MVYIVLYSFNLSHCHSSPIYLFFWPYLTPRRCLNHAIHRLCFPLHFLGLLIFILLIQSPVLMPPALTRLSDLLSWILPLFCSGIATCAYLYSDKIFCHMVIANVMNHLPHMLVGFWEQELLLSSYIASSWHFMWIRKRFLNWRRTTPGIQNTALLASKLHFFLHTILGIKWIKTFQGSGDSI